MSPLLRLYWRFLRAHLAEHLQYRITIYLWALWWFVQLFAYMMVWATVAGVQSVGGFDRSAFVAYYLVLMVVGRLTRSIDMWTLEHPGRLVREEVGTGREHLPHQGTPLVFGPRVVRAHELAERLGLKEQQIQRYEATRYSGVTLERIDAVAEALGVEIEEKVIFPVWNTRE